MLEMFSRVNCDFAQSWEPSKEFGALKRIQEAANHTSNGLLQWLWPGGLDIINTLSDWALNRLLDRTPPRKSFNNGVKALHETDANQDPNDVVAGIDILETVMPSSNPASGPRPHAPSQPTTSYKHSEQSICHKRSITEQEIDTARLANIGGVYNEVVKEEEVADFEALLGKFNIFKCEAYL